MYSSQLREFGACIPEPILEDFSPHYAEQTLVFLIGTVSAWRSPSALGVLVCVCVCVCIPALSTNLYVHKFLSHVENWWACHCHKESEYNDMSLLSGGIGISIIIRFIVLS